MLKDLEIYLQATKLILGVAVTVGFLVVAAFAAAAGFGFKTVGSALGIGFPSLVCSFTTF
jgi:hypothetical protein